MATKIVVKPLIAMDIPGKSGVKLAKVEFVGPRPSMLSSRLFPRHDGAEEMFQSGTVYVIASPYRMADVVMAKLHELYPKAEVTFAKADNTKAHAAKAA